jgi:16S rRNA (uracil1498-N3)-methyltransferase
MVRLYVSHPLAPQTLSPLSDDQVHYLRNVLRLKAGDTLSVFNDREGEWLARIHTLTKSRGDVEVIECLRLPTQRRFVGLAFAPLKQEPLLYLIEKATELGVSHLQPVILKRSVVTKFNREKAQRNALESSQQCERLDIPDVQELIPLQDFLKTLSGTFIADDALIVCQERAQPRPIGPILQEILSPKEQDIPQKIFFLIGPEGGFSPDELAYLATFPFTHFCSLGPLILRAETAALYALTAYQVIGEQCRKKELPNTSTTFMNGGTEGGLHFIKLNALKEFYFSPPKK